MSNTDFIKHLEKCSAEVATWPAWKRKILTTRPYVYEIIETPESKKPTLDTLNNKGV